MSTFKFKVVLQRYENYPMSDDGCPDLAKATEIIDVDTQLRDTYESVTLGQLWNEICSEVGRQALAEVGNEPRKD